MDIYRRKTLWKWGLFVLGVLIVAVSLWFSNILVKKIAAEERKKVSIWANAIQQKARLVNYTKEFFKKIEGEERKRVEIWAEATKRLINAGMNEDLSFYTQIISENTTIPVILTDNERNIIAVKNVDFKKDTVAQLNGNLYSEFSVNTPIVVNYGSIVNYLYYKESLLFSELRNVLNDLTESFFSEVVVNSASVPVIVVDSLRQNVFSYGNIDSTIIADSVKLQNLLTEMEGQNQPIQIDFEGHGQKFIYYKDSYLLTQLRYYPYVQFFVIGAFLLLAYMLFSITRRAEQNKVWVGMAKETAHQLGTPISSMLAWIDFIPVDENNKMYLDELRKDVLRLNNISERFSKIGSVPELKDCNIAEMIQDSVEYIQLRSSKKINFSVEVPSSLEYQVLLNKNLLGWVLENLMNNAADAMNGTGALHVILLDDEKNVFIDISDTGTGLHKSQFKAIFNPGYTTKSRGWGLGLALSKRIIEEYHKGKIFVKSSTLGKGTTFRIVLLKNKK